jgi:type II secretory pathway predicted ATPase ExeA
MDAGQSIHTNASPAVVQVARAVLFVAQLPVQARAAAGAVRLHHEDSSASLLELNARLKHLIDMRGIGLVTGDSGSGKTTACRSTVADLHSGLYCVL